MTSHVIPTNAVNNQTAYYIQYNEQNTETNTVTQYCTTVNNIALYHATHRNTWSTGLEDSRGQCRGLNNSIFDDRALHKSTYTLPLNTVAPASDWSGSVKSTDKNRHHVLVL